MSTASPSQLQEAPSFLRPFLVAETLDWISEPDRRQTSAFFSGEALLSEERTGLPRLDPA